MLFFFKPKPIVIDFFTPIPTVHEFFSIKAASKFIPEWWKHIPKTLVAQGKSPNTLKGCPGFIELYKQGFIIPAWSDFTIEVFKSSRFGGDCNFKVDVASSEIEGLFKGDPNITNSISTRAHNPSQWGNNFPEFTQIKFLTPWVMKQKSNINWLWIDPIWNNLEFTSELRVLSGVIQPNITRNINIQCFIRKSDSLIEIEAGQPMLHMIPITEKEVVVKNHLIDLQEWNKIRIENMPTFKFTGGHNWIKKFKKQEEEEKNKCPFN